MSFVPSRLLSIFPRLRLSLGMVAVLLIYIYLGFHALTGRQGLVSWSKYSTEVSVLETELKDVRGLRTQLELQVKRLQDTGLSLDSLGISARRLLNVSHVNDIVIWLDETP